MLGCALILLAFRSSAERDLPTHRVLCTQGGRCGAACPSLELPAGAGASPSQLGGGLRRAEASSPSCGGEGTEWEGEGISLALGRCRELSRARLIASSLRKPCLSSAGAGRVADPLHHPCEGVYEGRVLGGPLGRGQPALPKL